MAEENVVGKTNYWTQVAKEQAKALGYRSMKAHKCPNCKAFSLYKTRSMFMKVRYHCLNPYCNKSYNPKTGVYFTGMPPHFQRHKNIFHLFK